MNKDNTKGIIRAIKAYTKKFKMNNESYCSQISHVGDKFKLITPELSMILKDSALSCDSSIILNDSVPFQRYHFKTLFSVISTDNIACDTRLLIDKVRKLEKNKKQFEEENQYFRFIDFNPLTCEFTMAHKENNMQYVRLNSNAVKTALRIISMCGDDCVQLCYGRVAPYKYPLLMFFENGVFIIKSEDSNI